jgi:hypothetical protein
MASVTVYTADKVSDLLETKADLLHAASHADGGSDEVTLALSQITGLVSALAAKASTTHASTHATGGGDEVTLAQAQITGLVAALAAKASTTHATTHASAGSDPITIAESQVTNLTTDLAAKADASATTTALAGKASTTHATTHASAGSDPVTLAQSQVTGLTTSLSGKASTTHATTHASAGSDPITIAESQVTNLTTDLAAKASTTHATTHASAGSDPVTLAQSQITGLTSALAALLSIASTLASGTTTLLSSKVTADTQQRLIIDASGKHTWGSGSATGDTTLYRSAADTLRTEDNFHAEKEIRSVVKTGDSTHIAFGSFYEGDTINSYQIENDGKHEWGDGGTFSTNLYSDTGGSLKTDGAFKIGAALAHQGSTVGFNNTTPISKPTVTGSRGSNAALASLCTALANLGLITNSTS